MRRTINLSLLASIGALLAAGDAACGPAPTPRFSTPVVTEDFLRDLDLEQLRSCVARSEAARLSAGRLKNERDPCVTMATDKAIADTKNADLITFHEDLAHNRTLR